MSEKQIASQLEQSIDIVYTDGRKEALTLRPLPVARYPKAFAAYKRNDLLEMVALYANKHRIWCDGLEPASLTAMTAAMLEGNPDFFAFVAISQKLANGIRLESSDGQSTSQNSPPQPD